MNKYHTKTARRDPLGSANSKQQNYQEADRLERLANKGPEKIEDTTRTELRQHAARLRTAAGKRGR